MAADHIIESAPLAATYGPATGPAAESVRVPDWSRTLAGTSAALAVLDPVDDAIVFATPAFAAMHGRTVDELLGRTVAELCTPGAAARLADVLGQLAAERVLVFDSEHRRRDGQPFPVHVDARSLVEHPRGWYRTLVVTDLTEHVAIQAAERDARAAAEQAAERVRRIQVLSSALAHALTPDDVARLIVRHGLEALGADAAFVARLGDDGETIETLLADGFPPELVEAYRAFPLDTRVPVAEAIRTGAAVWVERAGDRDGRFDDRLTTAVRALPAAAVLPLVAHGRTIGAVGFSYRAERAFPPDERSFLGALASHYAQALLRAQLFEAEQRARAEAEAMRAEAERARRRSAFLAEASRLLGGSLDYADTLQRVARSVVPELADWCAVDLLTDTGGAELVAVAHADPAKTPLWHRLRECVPVVPTAPHGLPRVLRDGTSEFIPRLDDAMLVATARNPEHLALTREVGIRSYICVPLRVRDQMLGALTLVYTAESGRHYDESDVALAEELARRAATAIDHARAFRAAQIANQVKSEFLAVMSHELRTPLNAIGGYVELLELELRGPVTDAQRRDLERIRVSQQHLLGLISAVLDLSRIESGHVAYRIEPVPVDAFLRTMDALIGPQVAAKSLALDFGRCDPALGVLADREKLRQVVLNLLSNAVRYTPAGGRVSVRAEGRGDLVAIRVEDNGVGIPTDALERIFEPFVQLDRSLTPAREGVGLGLAISRDLARGMAGDLTAASALGVGSAFTLTLPRAPGDAPAAWTPTAQLPATRRA